MDQDGQCLKCRAFYLKLGADFTRLTDEYNRKLEVACGEFKAAYQALGTEAYAMAQNKDLCDACGRRYVDLTFSKLVGCLSIASPATAQAGFDKIIRHIRKGLRNLKLPLTMRAWTKVKAGWPRK